MNKNKWAKAQSPPMYNEAKSLPIKLRNQKPVTITAIWDAIKVQLVYDKGMPQRERNFKALKAP